MVTQRLQMKEVLPWLVLWACHAGTRDFRSALAALVGPVQNIFFLAVHFFNSFVPIAQQAGQAVVLGTMSFSMYLSTPNPTQLQLQGADTQTKNS